MTQRVTLALVLMTSMLLLSGCSSTAASTSPTTPAPKTFTASGSVDVALDLQDAMKASGGPAQGQPCKPKPTYDDVLTERVQIKDDSGKTVALGEVTDGTLQPQPENKMVLFARCRLAFSVPDVPDGKFFTIQVGDPDREPGHFTKAELVAGVEMSLAKSSEINN